MNIQEVLKSRGPHKDNDKNRIIKKNKMPESTPEYKVFLNRLFGIRKLLPGCFPGGFEMFKRAGKRKLSIQFPPETDQTEYIDKEINVYTSKSKDHYEIKNQYYTSADFVISRNKVNDGPVGFGRQIHFRVQLAGDQNIGGSLSYLDLNLHNDDDLEIFNELFSSTAFPTTGLPIEQIQSIISFMTARFHKEIHNAMVREIQEECTPSGGKLLPSESISSNISYIGINVNPVINKSQIDLRKGVSVTSNKVYSETESKAVYISNKGKVTPATTDHWKFVVTFVFHSSVPFRKRREMDIFCTKFSPDGPIQPLYFIYTGRKGHLLYYDQPPYTIPEETSTKTVIEPVGGAGAASISNNEFDPYAMSEADYLGPIKTNENQVWFDEHIRGKSTYWPATVEKSKMRKSYRGGQRSGHRTTMKSKRY
jgi:hypothetical protein